MQNEKIIDSDKDKLKSFVTLANKQKSYFNKYREDCDSYYYDATYLNSMDTFNIFDFDNPVELRRIFERLWKEDDTIPNKQELVNILLVSTFKMYKKEMICKENDGDIELPHYVYNF